MLKHEGEVNTENNSVFGWYVTLDGQKIYFCEHPIGSIKAIAMLGLQKIAKQFELIKKAPRKD